MSSSAQLSLSHLLFCSFFFFFFFSLIETCSGESLGLLDRRIAAVFKDERTTCHAVWDLHLLCARLHAVALTHTPLPCSFAGAAELVCNGNAGNLSLSSDDRERAISVAPTDHPMLFFFLKSIFPNGHSTSQQNFQDVTGLPLLGAERVIVYDKNTGQPERERARSLLCSCETLACCSPTVRFAEWLAIASDIRSCFWRAA